MVNREYTFYNSGFFGYGEKGDFTYWSIAHFLPIIILIGAMIALYRLRHRIREWKHEENLRFILGFIMLITEMSYYWRLIYVGSGRADLGTLMTKIPIQVCQWTCIFAAFMIMKKSRIFYEICYFVCLTLGLMPLITPAVIITTGPGYYRYYQFWLEHLLPIFAVFYMTFVHGFRVTVKKIWQPIIFLDILAVFSVYGNSTVDGANFMYLATKTEGDSLANLFPENVFLRLAVYGIIMIIMFAIAYLPTYIAQKRKR